MNAGRLFALLILLFGVGYLGMALQIAQPNTVAAVGPRVFPLAIGVGLIISAVWLLGWPGAVEAPTSAEAFDWLRAIGLLILLAAYIALYRPLGYLLSTILFMGSASQLLGERSTLRRDLLIALLLPVVISFVFARLLGINLPEGVIGW